MRKVLEILAALGSIVLNGIVVPVLIEQYPEYFKDNPWILPISVVLSAALFLPLLLHYLGPILIGGAHRQLGVRYPIMAWIVVIVVGALIGAAISAGGYWLFLKHEQHLAKSHPAVLPEGTPSNPPQPQPLTPAPAPNVHSGKKGSRSSPWLPSPSLTLNSSLQPAEPYADSTILAGIVWDRRYVDVRLDVSSGAASVENLDFLIGLDTSIAGVGQISQIPGITMFPADSPPPAWLQGTDLQGNPVSVPMVPAPGMASFAPVYRVQCSKLFANTTLHFVIASVALNPMENGKMPKQLFGVRRAPAVIHVKGKYETRMGSAIQSHDIDFSYKLRQL